jgi:choline-sulfatase
MPTNGVLSGAGQLREIRRRRRRLGLVPVALTLCALATLLTPWLLPGCARDQRPSLILIIMDTTRQDRLGCYGYQEAATRTLDSLATAGVRFTNAITATPVTGPAIATILSGALPPVHGVRDNARFIINSKLTMLAEVFADAGYQTGAVVAALPIKSDYGYQQGFTFYDDRFAEDRYELYNQAFAAKLEDLQQSERRAHFVTERALQWLQKVDKGKPLFLLAHYYDPHGPYDPPPAYHQRRREDPYDGEIAYMDAEIGRLLAGARQRFDGRREIRVVAVGDHGEGLFDHEEWTHGFFLYDTTVKVPLIACGDGARRGLTVDHNVRTRDIAPTVCAWFGLSIPATFSGENLTTALSGGGVPAVCDTAYLETFLTQFQHNWSPLQGMRTARWKWIKAPRPELYDLQTDPDEARNLADQDLPPQRLLADRMDDLFSGTAGLAAQVGASPSSIDPNVARQLAALGYVAGHTNESPEPDYSLIDPKDGNRDWNREQDRKKSLDAARIFYREGKLEDALSCLSRAEEIEPLAGQDAAMRGELASRLGQYETALSAFIQALHTEGDPAGRGFIRLRLARALLALGRLRQAEAQIETLRTIPGAPASFQTSVEELAAEIDQKRTRR